MDRILFLLLLGACLVSAAPASQTMTLSGVIRDQAPASLVQTGNSFSYSCIGYGGSAGTANGGKGFNGTDFELPTGTYLIAEKGLVGNQCNGTNWLTCGALGADKTPVYAYSGPSPGMNVRSPASFYTWFHDSPQTVNVPINLVLSQVGASDVYSYTNSSFFPIDGLGWGDHCNRPYNHNYGFCLEVHSRFLYKGGEVFNFLGDDDVWVYINNKLVLDLGGLHTPMPGVVYLDQIPNLVLGVSYPFDFFYCERHSTESYIQISTSLSFFCGWYDWCGVCEGNGQSCCTTPLCDDHNQCTVDSCPIIITPHNSSECLHAQVNCSVTTDACHEAGCDPSTGCYNRQINCDDKDVCTVDTCDSITGCHHTVVSCNDQNACTLDSCNPALGCSHVQVSCDDHNACTQDTCNGNLGCMHTVLPCQPPNACYTSSCNASTGCQHVRKQCDDLNACTLDACDTISGCVHSPMECDSEADACAVGSCDKLAGCQLTNITCDDGNKCTSDSCSSSTGCINVPANCDDGNHCTLDFCDPQIGCYSEAMSCDDASVCTVDYCDSKLGCQFIPLSCNDQNTCTTDSCDASLGCLYTEVACNSSNVCLAATCNASAGCEYTPVVCDDGSACTLDSCDSQLGCLYKAISCDDASVCTVDSCDSELGCQFTPLSCDDQNTCTTDSCDAFLGCLHTEVLCDASNACLDVTCNSSAGCQYTPVVCDDNNVCTLDNCDVHLGCTYTSMTCNDGNACTVDSCDPVVGCLALIVSCDDDNACTSDSCNANSGCTHDALHCNDANVCTVDSCDVLSGCKYTNISCSSEGTATCDLRSCDPSGGCHYSPIIDAVWDNVLLNTWTDNTGVHTQWSAVLRTKDIPLRSVTFDISPNVFGIWNADLRSDGLYALPVWQYRDGIIPAHSEYVMFGYTIDGTVPATITLSSGICAPEFTGCEVRVSNVLVNSWVNATGYTIGQFNLVVNNVGSRVLAHVNVTISPPVGILSDSWNLIPSGTGDEFECQLWNLWPGQSTQVCGFNVEYATPTAALQTFDITPVEPLCI